MLESGGPGRILLTGPVGASLAGMCRSLRSATSRKRVPSGASLSASTVVRDGGAWTAFRDP